MGCFTKKNLFITAIIFEKRELITCPAVNFLQTVVLNSKVFDKVDSSKGSSCMQCQIVPMLTVRILCLT